MLNLIFNKEFSNVNELSKSLNFLIKNNCLIRTDNTNKATINYRNGCSFSFDKKVIEEFYFLNPEIIKFVIDFTFKETLSDSMELHLNPDNKKLISAKNRKTSNFYKKLNEKLLSFYRG